MLVEGSLGEDSFIAKIKKGAGHIFGKDGINLPMGRLKRSMDMRWNNYW